MDYKETNGAKYSKERVKYKENTVRIMCYKRKGMCQINIWSYSVENWNLYTKPKLCTPQIPSIINKKKFFLRHRQEKWHLFPAFFPGNPMDREPVGCSP